MAAEAVLWRQFQHENTPHDDSHDPSFLPLPQSTAQTAILTLSSHQESHDRWLLCFRKTLPLNQEV